MAPSITVDWEGPAEENGDALMAVGLDAREIESTTTDRLFRVEDRMEVGGRKGAQHNGTVSGFGAANGRVDRGRRRWLAERSNEAVVKVIAKATANLS